MIAVECFADEALVRALGVPLANILHARSKGRVVKSVREGQASAGLVDEDPGKTQPRDMARFRETERKGAVALLSAEGNPARRLIQIRPRLEEWLVSRAASCGLALAEYGLPPTAKALKDRGRYDRARKFQEFLQALLEQDAEMQALKQWTADWQAGHVRARHH